jgi:ectoine hydroxylase-related dioxygenase (phytanoyl-CoA dioxygenase family)
MDTRKKELSANGFAILNDVFTEGEVADILSAIERIDSSGPSFRKRTHLYAIRCLFKEARELFPLVFTEKIKQLVKNIAGSKCFVIKSIYFDKPASSNWFVSFHQDLIINVISKAGLEGYSHWSRKENYFSVQPPLHVLENIYTLRIHLDATDQDNGALNVIPGSHKRKICRPESLDLEKEEQVACKVNRGGIMLMRPLLLHSSGRTLNNKRRRVIHVEITDTQLPAPLNWAEFQPL